MDTLQIVTTQLRLYPRSRIQDIYKAIFQASMGPEHAILDEDRARSYLEQEYGAVNPDDPQPLLEPLGREFARVHLRPAKMKDIPCGDILQVFLDSAALGGSRDALRNSIEWLKEQDFTHLGFTPIMVSDYLSSLAIQGYPAVHHSELFRSEYKPAYRLIRQELIPVQWL